MKLKVPGTYTIISALLVLSAVATWIVPQGESQLFSLFTALYKGFVKQSGIIVFILIVGGTFWLLNTTGAITAGIGRFINRVGNYRRLVLTAITILFSLAGAVFGMSEETIPFVGIVVPMVVAMGYDAFLGMLIVYVAANVGFSAAFLNPFTVGIAQQMAELPLFSGMEFRIFCWVVLTALLVCFILWYMGRSAGKCADRTVATDVTAADTAAVAARSMAAAKLNWRQQTILWILFASIVLLIVGVAKWEWYMGEISGLFLAMGIICGMVAGYDADKISSEMVAGAKDILSSAMVVGLASGIIVILQDGKVIDTMLEGIKNLLEDTGRAGSLSAMYGIQAVINMVIPSATAKAAVTIPIMSPFSDMVGVSRQAMVLAFQFGDGFTNMITPTSGVLIASLSMARISYAQWVRRVWKPVLVLMTLGLMLLLLTLFVDF